MESLNMMQTNTPKQETEKPSPPPRGYFDGKIPVVVIKRKK
jgi:hypothetical protein